VKHLGDVILVASNNAWY